MIAWCLLTLHLLSILTVLICAVQDKDLKQYLDDCGNCIHMHNVKVRVTAVLHFTAALLFTHHTDAL